MQFYMGHFYYKNIYLNAYTATAITEQSVLHLLQVSLGYVWINATLKIELLIGAPLKTAAAENRCFQISSIDVATSVMAVT